MLLSTIYGLNSSHMKRLHMGLQISNEEIFVQIIKLISKCVDRVFFYPNSWQQFQDNIGLMNEYLSKENKLKPDFIISNNISILSLPTKLCLY